MCWEPVSWKPPGSKCSFFVSHVFLLRLAFFTQYLFQPSSDNTCKVIERMTSSKRLGKVFTHKHYSLSNVIITYNVDTLFEAKSSCKNSKAFDRRTLLSEEFPALGWNIVFLQETRSSKGTSYTDHYVCFSSGCSNGNFWVETWISKLLLVCHDGTVSQLRVSSKKVVEVFFSDRSLGLHFQIESISLSILLTFTLHKAAYLLNIEPLFRITYLLVVKS